jgi:SAM-dependent methyltransferase
MSVDRRPVLAYFEALFACSDDPWGFRRRWYETRKRALTLACLPAPRYRSAYEPGCANGELSAALAERCDRLLISDAVGAAVELARRRVEAYAQVEVVQASVLDPWPRQAFDLVVISELGYYLEASALESVARHARASLRPGGTLLACHWRHAIEGCELSGDQVHERLAAGLQIPHLSNLTDADLRIDVWCLDARSVAEREGFA